MTDRLTIEDLELWTHIGVTEEERKTEQRLLVTIELTLDLSKAGQSDDVADTIDYAAVVDDVKTLAKTPRKTMEKLAEDCAQLVLQKYKPAGVTVEVKKFALAGIRHAAVKIERK